MTPLRSAAAVRADVDDARRLEESTFNYLHSRRQLLYDGWILFLSPGTAKRARSVNAFYPSSLPVADKIAHCEALYARHGLPALFRITPCVQPRALDETLAARGYVAFDRTLVQARALGDAPPEPPPVSHGAADALVLSSPLPEAFVEAVGTMRGSTAGQRAAHLERLAQTPLDIVQILAREGGTTVGAGMVSIDGDLAGLFDIVTAPARRRRGIGTRVVHGLLSKAWERGARQAFLQVNESNRAALSIYARAGFATRYAYHYRARPGEVE